MQKNDILKIAIAVVVILTLLFFGIRALLTKREPVTPITLRFWGVFDDSDAYDDAILKFKALHPAITVDYTKFTYEEYERELIDGLSKKRGPDILMLHNSYIPRYKAVLYPAPKGAISINDIKKSYAPVVLKNFTSNDAVYGIPLYLSTLALYYNKDLFAEHSITYPPQSWDEFLRDSELIKRIDSNGNILTAGTAMGTSNNINRAVDIVYALMLQSGVNFYTTAKDGKTSTSFSRDYNIDGKIVNPGERALKFYTDFANPKKNVYTYNSTLDYSIDLFAEGKVGMMLNYNWQLKTLRQKNGLLNIGIAPLPQINPQENAVTFPNYWGLAVNKSSPNRDWAWEFIKFLQQPDNVKLYAQKTNTPVARTDLISWQISAMPDLAVFASQILYADDFPRSDDVAYEKIFSTIIDNVVYDYASAKSALEKGESEINKIMVK